jgi:hypothetical protein
MSQSLLQHYLNDPKTLDRFLRGRRRAIESYRLTYRADGFPQHRFHVRVDRYKSRCRLIGQSLRLDENGEWTIDRTTTRLITLHEWDEFDRLLRECSFWELPFRDENVGMDGEWWMMEGAKSGRFHLVRRWTTGMTTKFQAACEILASLAGCR